MGSDSNLFESTKKITLRVKKYFNIRGPNSKQATSSTLTLYCSSSLATINLKVQPVKPNVALHFIIVQSTQIQKHGSSPYIHGPWQTQKNRRKPFISIDRDQCKNISEKYFCQQNVIVSMTTNKVRVL